MFTITGTILLGAPFYGNVIMMIGGIDKKRLITRDQL